jgi:CRISPR/Cas system-associated exonuclease Cas4 (RecB family)
MSKKVETIIEVVTSDSEHWYPSKRSNNRTVYYPSVTTILSVWPKGVGFNKYLTSQDSWESSQEILQSAGKRGTLVHKATEYLEDGIVLKREAYNIDEWEMLMGYCKWRQEHQFLLQGMELPLVSDKLKTGGTIDRVFKTSPNGHYMILDIKTSNSIYGNYWVQVAAYAEMYEQHFGIEIEEVAILRLTQRRKDRFEYKTMNRSFWKDEFKAFKSIQHIWNHINPDAQPKILELPTTLSLK